jgi:hypothetical protein
MHCIIAIVVVALSSFAAGFFLHSVIVKKSLAEKEKLKQAVKDLK